MGFRARHGAGGATGKAVVLPLARQDAAALLYRGYGDGVAGYGAVHGDGLACKGI